MSLEITNVASYSLTLTMLASVSVTPFHQYFVIFDCWSLLRLSFFPIIGLSSHQFHPYLPWCIRSSYILSISHSTLSDCISEALFAGKNLQSLVNPGVCLPTPTVPSHRLLSTTGKIRQPDTPNNS